MKRETVIGAEQELEKLAAAIDESLPEDGDGQGGSSSQESEQEKIASRTTEELTVALKEQIDQGLIEVEQRDGKVFVTVGSGGAFPSGTADLTDEAQRIIDRIALSAMSPDSSIKVTGHTDDVPISNGQFRDNWDLGAGRAASVVQAIQNTGLIAGDRLEAVSKGEMEPLADNSTAAGREKIDVLRLKFLTRLKSGRIVILFLKGKFNGRSCKPDYLSLVNKSVRVQCVRTVTSIVAAEIEPKSLSTLLNKQK